MRRRPPPSKAALAAVRLLCIALSCPAMPAWAQTDGSQARADYDVIGRTPVVCALTLGDGGASGLINFRAVDRNMFQIDQLVNQATMSTQAASFALSLSAVCNAAHVVRFESLNNGLWQLSQLPAQRPAGFGTAIPYALSARWSDQQAQLTADAGVRGPRLVLLPVASPASGVMTLQFSIQPGATNLVANAPIVAGAYTDSLTIILEPQQ